jgi:hypothetical protein
MRLLKIIKSFESDIMIWSCKVQLEISNALLKSSYLKLFITLFAILYFMFKAHGFICITQKFKIVFG